MAYKVGRWLTPVFQDAIDGRVGVVVTDPVDTNRALPQTLTDTTAGQTTAYTWRHRDHLTATTTTAELLGISTPWATIPVPAQPGAPGLHLEGERHETLVCGHAPDPLAPKTLS